GSPSQHRASSRSSAARRLDAIGAARKTLGATETCVLTVGRSFSEDWTRDDALKPDQPERGGQLRDLLGVGHRVAAEPFAQPERRIELPDLLPLPFGVIAASCLNQGRGKKDAHLHVIGVASDRLSQVPQCGWDVAEKVICAT